MSICGPSLAPMVGCDGSISNALGERFEPSPFWRYHAARFKQERPLCQRAGRSIFFAASRPARDDASSGSRKFHVLQH